MFFRSWEVWHTHSCIHLLQGVVLYKMLTIFGEFRVFLITLGLKFYNHKEFDFVLVFFLIGLIKDLTQEFKLNQHLFLWFQTWYFQSSRSKNQYFKIWSQETYLFYLSIFWCKKNLEIMMMIMTKSRIDLARWIIIETGVSLYRDKFWCIDHIIPHLFLYFQ
jgi:hypothetical protein